MGTTHTEARLSKLRNRSSILIPVYCILSAIVGSTLAGPLAETRVKNDTLKMCNERPLECKFKYDILKYNETGQVPYKVEKEVK